jgi:NADPH:quinone reductase-like Zn-dependent oxidoreductase
MNKMKAVVCTKYGPPEVLKLKEVNKPIARDNEVLVKIFATNVTVGDIRVRAFDVPLSFWLPARLMLGITKPKKDILGSIFAGQIEAVGKTVKNFKAGEKVFGSAEDHGGAYAEYVCVPEDSGIALMPANLSYNEASSVIWGGATSLYFLKKANIKAGQSILINGASGSLGTAAVQLAKHFGAKVTGVCSLANVELVRSLGADRVIDYTKNDFAGEDIKYDAIFDTVGKADESKVIHALLPTGKYIHSVATPATEIKIKLALMGTKKEFVGGTFKVDADMLKEVKKLAEEGVLKPVIDRIYRLDEIVEAHRYVDLGHKKGNVVVSVV